ncbi:MAG: DUF2914 domain-containing protein [Deltaproteobacteria bacterium]|nr:DUF2914 domain-containing protein [Deltaproteobacteria bacterium]
MKNLIAAGIIPVFIISFCAKAGAGITLVEASISKAVVNLAPSGAAEKFSPTAGKLFCYTKVEGAKAGEMVTHRWYYKETLMAVIPLEIKSPAYRTYSSKKILPSWTGKWRVEIVGEDGTLLKTIPFTVE